MPEGYETNESSIAVFLIRGHLDVFLFLNAIRRHVSSKAVPSRLKENTIYPTMFTCSSWGVCTNAGARLDYRARACA